MKNKFKQFTRYIFQFGIFKGISLYYKNFFLKKGISAFSLKNHAHPLLLRRSTSDIKAFNQVFLNGEYRFHINFSPKFIIDCGANIGLASLYFKAAYPDAFIVAIEPESSNYEMLLKNTKSYTGIECIKAGIWNKNALLKVESLQDNDHWGFVCREVTEETENTIRATSIPEIMQRYNKTEIDILKIDIEGSELELFSSGYEAWLPFTKVIVIELHDTIRKGCSKSFFNAFAQYDFSIQIVGENILAIRN
jgi:FkbM family methyltransferase